jgi:ribosomal protein S18 acetylase RimI-like enzyme
MIMITFRAMQPEEFPEYRDYFIVDYAHEIAANYGYPLEKSQAIALKELNDDLPQTVSTPDNILLCIEKEGAETIGYLWYKLLDEGESVFILDFVLFEDFRGLGYGQTALLALEDQLFQSGVEQIKLRVAFNNRRALSLYEKVGFNITGYNMVKIRPAFSDKTTK